MDNKKDKFAPLTKADDPKNLVVVSLFEKDNFFLFIYKKTERIVSALYLTSSLFSDSEPIKWQLREVGVAVIARVLSLTDSPLSKPETVSKIKSDLLRLLSLLDIASNAGFISEMNFSILKKELESIVETLLLKVSPNDMSGAISGKLNKEFFALPRQLFFSAPNPQDFSRLSDSTNEPNAEQLQGSLYSWADVSRLEDAYKRQNKGHGNDIQSFTQSPLVRKAGHNNKGQNLGSDAVPNSRELTIIKMLKDKSNLTIRDFFLVIKGCSEKTIQRELLRLVRIGVLKKSGERRWSRYSLSTS